MHRDTETGYVSHQQKGTCDNCEPISQNTGSASSGEVVDKKVFIINIDSQVANKVWSMMKGVLQRGTIA